MKKIITLLTLTLFISCKKQNTIDLYCFETEINDVMINGNNLKDFFVKNNRMNISKKTFELSPDLEKDINNLITTFSEKGHIDSLGMGIYYYAIIHGNDTLYSGTDFKTWKYKNKTRFYESEIIQNELLIDK